MKVESWKITELKVVKTGFIFKTKNIRAQNWLVLEKQNVQVLLGRENVQRFYEFVYI